MRVSHKSVPKTASSKETSVESDWALKRVTDFLKLPEWQLDSNTEFNIFYIYIFIYVFLEGKGEWKKVVAIFLFTSEMPVMGQI